MSRVWSYVTDVEGNFEYWSRFIQLSKVLSRSSNGALVLKDGSGFIHGGDSVDKGIGGDLRIMKDFMQLKTDYPDRVHFIIGNRDANKLRFASELQNAESLSPAYWLAPEKRPAYPSFLEKHSLTDSRTSRIKYMLAETMGSATTFEGRRAELQVLGKESTDDAVVDSFLELIDVNAKDNHMLQYLEAGKLIFRIGETLFVHGAISDINVGAVPGDDIVRSSLDEWIKDLNEFVTNELNAYRKQQTWEELPDANTGKGKRGGDALMDYGVPGGNGGKTVIYATFLDNGNGQELSKGAEEYLLSNGIKRIVVGHTPHGDCPTIINSNQIQIVLGDTSYSDMSKEDNRGIAVSEILLHEESQEVSVHGVLKDERTIAYKLALPGVDSDVADTCIGTHLKNDFWVHSKLESIPEDGKAYMAVKGEGFRLFVEWLTANEVEEQKQ